MASAKKLCSQNGRLSITLASRAALGSILGALVIAGGMPSCSSVNETKPAVNVAGGKAEQVSNANGGAGVRAGSGTANALPASVMSEEIKALDGGSFKLSDYAGKVVVLDLWATWCPPCRDEIPHLVAMSKEYQAQGLEVIGLDVDPLQDDAETVRDFAQEFAINYKIGWAERDLAASLMRGNGSIPQTLVITRDGRVLEHFIGYNPRRTPAKMRQAVEQALKM